MIDWFWIAIALYLLGVADCFIDAEDMRDTANEVIEEMERDDDFARVSGWMRSDGLFWAAATLEAVFWPIWMAWDLITWAFRKH